MGIRAGRVVLLGVCAVVFATCASPAHALPRFRRGEAGFTLAHYLERGVAASLRLLRFGYGARLPDDRARLARAQGRQVLNFPVREAAPGVFVHVSGEVEFERADIGFADGSVQSVEAYGLDRDSGLYELASFDNPRSIEWVRLVLRSRSRHARVGIKLGVR